MRIGFGYDSHRFVGGRKLILGGAEIPCEMGLEGHSDADVLAHAIGDAILGSLCAGDLGSHFPDSDSAWKNVSSLRLLENIRTLAEKKGYIVHNVDSTIVLESPRLMPYITEMQRNIEKALASPSGTVSVKATTNEKMGFTGREEGIAAFAVVTVKPSEISR